MSPKYPSRSHWKVDFGTKPRIFSMPPGKFIAAMDNWETIFSVKMKLVITWNILIDWCPLSFVSILLFILILSSFWLVVVEILLNLSISIYNSKLSPCCLAQFGITCRTTCCYLLHVVITFVIDSWLISCDCKVCLLRYLRRFKFIYRNERSIREKSFICF